MSSRITTYGRRAKRQRRSQDADTDDATNSAEEVAVTPQTPKARKRQKVQVEVVLPVSPRTPKNVVAPSPRRVKERDVDRSAVPKRRRDEAKAEQGHAISELVFKRTNPHPKSVVGRGTPARVGRWDSEDSCFVPSTSVVMGLNAPSDPPLPTFASTSKKAKGASARREVISDSIPSRSATPARVPKPSARSSLADDSRRASYVSDEDALPVHIAASRRAKAGRSTKGSILYEVDLPDRVIKEHTKTPSPRSAQNIPETFGSPRPLKTYLSRTPSKNTSPPDLLFGSSPLTPYKSPVNTRAVTHVSRASTPRTPPKDLSDLFNFNSAPNLKGKVKGTNMSSTLLGSRRPKIPIAKRMLARTKTEPTLDDLAADSSNSIISISDTQSVSQQSAAAKAQSIVDVSSQSQLQPSSLSGPSAPAAPPTNIRTYAGRSRSFLVELPAGGAADDDLGLEVRESYTDLRVRWGVDNSEDDPQPVSPDVDSSSERAGMGKGKGKGKAHGGVVVKTRLPPGMMNDLKSITELRSKGESRRFMDEVGYLFEGMEKDAGIGVRRGSALEIVTKLCDPDFSRRAKATDFLSRAWDVLRNAGAGDGDKVLDSILALFAALVAQAARDLQEFAQKPDFVPVLCGILSFAQRGKDPLALVVDGEGDAELKKAGIGKPEKLMLMSLRTVIIKKSGLCSSGTCPPVRQLISQTLSALPSSSLQPTYFPAIHRSLLPELVILPSRLLAYTAGLRLLPDSSSENNEMPAFEHIENCLSILDSFLLGRWAETEEPNELGDDVINGERQDGLAEGLVTLCVVCSIVLLREELEEQRDTANRCTESALRVLINLSHDNATWCKLLLRQGLTMPIVASLIARFQTPRKERSHKNEEISMQGDDGDAQAFDRLCLALGLLTNLVQADEGSAKDLVRATKFDPSCKCERACARACHCVERVNALEGLVRVYVSHRTPEDTDMNDPGAHIVTGHLAVLFGLLMRGSEENERIVLNALPGGARRAKLDGLLGSVHEFAGLYREFMMRVARGEGKDDEEADDGDDGDDDGATRGFGSGGSVQGVVGDGASEGVTRDVIELLQKLRDR